MTKSTIKKVINEQISSLVAKLYALGDRMQGSGWVLKRHTKLAIDLFSIKVARGAYIPTPERYASPKRGLINLKNKDQECFRWCVRYHVSPKEKHDDRISVLSKIQDKYDYTGIDFPATYDDMQNSSS